jgi:hypothetical protein
LPAGIVLVQIAKGRLEYVAILAANDFPTDAILVSTTVGIGIDQETGDGVISNRFEEGLVSRVGSVAPAGRHPRLGSAESFENGVLLLGSGG